MGSGPFKGFALSYLICALIFAITSAVVKILLTKDGKPSLSIIIVSGIAGAAAVFLALKLFPGIMSL